MALFTAIASAVTAVGAWVGSLGIIGSALLKTAVGIGLNVLAQSLAGKPKDPTFSINTTIQGGAMFRARSCWVKLRLPVLSFG